MSSSWTINYGAVHPDQFMRLHLPSIEENNDHLFPTVFIVHGGFWKKCYNLDNSLIDSLIPYLLHKKYAVCHVEYRRVGDHGGWPETNDDIIAALQEFYKFVIERLQQRQLDINKVIVLGHSAGGTLALWTCCSHNIPIPFAPLLCVAIAPIGDLEEGQKRRLSDNGDAIEQYLKIDSDDTISNICRFASPVNLLPLKTKCLIVIGEEDDVIPVDMVEQFHLDAVNYCLDKQYLPQLLKIPNADHFDVELGLSLFSVRKKSKQIKLQYSCITGKKRFIFLPISAQAIKRTALYRVSPTVFEWSLIEFSVVIDWVGPC
eukprot:gene10081-13547_t